MSAPPLSNTGERERRRLRWFVAAHVGLGWAIYGVALAVGDGLAPPPFPPSVPTPGLPVAVIAPAASAPAPAPAGTEAPASASSPWADRGGDALPPPALTEPGPALPALAPR